VVLPYKQLAIDTSNVHHRHTSSQSEALLTYLLLLVNRTNTLASYISIMLASTPQITHQNIAGPPLHRYILFLIMSVNASLLLSLASFVNDLSE
jgi:hypothetical protein